METLKQFCSKYQVNPKKTVLENGDWSLYFSSNQVGICIILDQVTNPFNNNVSYELSFTTCEAFKDGTCNFNNQGSKRTPMRVRGFLLDFLSSLRNDEMMSFIRDLKFDAEAKRLNIYIRALDKEYQVCKKAYQGERDTWTIQL